MHRAVAVVCSASESVAPLYKIWYASTKLGLRLIPEEVVRYNIRRQQFRIQAETLC